MVKIWPFLTRSCLLAMVCLSVGLDRADAAEAKAMQPPLPELPMVAVAPPDPAAEKPVASTQETKIPLNSSIQVEAEDPLTGETLNIDINSQDLTYNSETGVYIVTGDVYIIIPQKNTEILADKVVYNPKTSNMVATGNVFIIQEEQVIGSDEATYDMEKSISTYVEPRTLTDLFRLRSRDAMRTDQFIILRQGRIILEPEVLTTYGRRIQRKGIRLGSGAVYSFYTASRRNQLLAGDIGDLLVEEADPLMESTSLEEEQDQVVNKPVSPRDIANADFNTGDSSYRLHVKRIDVRRGENKFDEIYLKNVQFKYKALPPAIFPYLELGYQEEEKYLAYLGADTGYNVNYGGFFYSPGWDKQILNGWIKLSPMLTYGGGRRVSTAGKRPQDISPELGVGVLASYLSPTTRGSFAYSTTLQQPVYLATQELFGRNQTKLMVGGNQLYRNGFFGQERPNFIAQVVDRSTLLRNSQWILQSYVTAGMARDNFYPTRQRNYFVNPTADDPVTTSRLQLQLQLRPAAPLLYIDDIATVGVLSQGRLSLYGTGDTFGVFQVGPYANLVAGPWFSQVRYLYSQSVGETPFVFDSYYQGRNNLQLINSLELGRFVTVGALQGLSLTRDNARDALLVNQKLFVSVGSKNVRFSLAYDTIQRQTYFGLTINPEGGQAVVDFDRMNIYQPGYNNQPLPTLPPLAPKRKTQ